MNRSSHTRDFWHSFSQYELPGRQIIYIKFGFITMCPSVQNLMKIKSELEVLLRVIMAWVGSPAHPKNESILRIPAPGEK